jgi:cyclopropane fatty-acyl-phospholipid synthase-like methyltransferase
MPPGKLISVPDNSTDSDWETFARAEPYWSVLAADEFKRENLTSEGIDRFFRSGEQHVASIVDTLSSRFAVPRTFGLSLDFGCGVGRLLFPLAAISKKAVGLDVSSTMLALCRKHGRERQVDNIELHESDDALTPVARYSGAVDLITSYIVFQHIPPRRGYRIFDGLVRLLRPGGVGFLHLTFAAAMQTVQYESCNVSGSLYGFYQRTTEGLMKLAEYPAGDAQIQMNHYNVNDLFCRLYQNGIADVFVRFTNHANTIGAEFYFQKSR